MEVYSPNSEIAGSLSRYLASLAANSHGFSIVIEHDGSLSRNDIFFGDNHSFNPVIFNTVAAHFTQDTISIQTAAKARTARIAAARAANPTFNFTATQDQFSQFESALYLRVFGRGTEGFARTQWVEIMFRTILPPQLISVLLCLLLTFGLVTGEERLPYAEGFRRSRAVLTNDEIVTLAQKVANASSV